ncbi:MAG TPA: radical SAM/SPASM domain-containing protein [Spirochaetia bacterium]|nr:MAG: hypothetical protein A2Y41_04145 [Spirochaetes bacterium GWB1_36_13]HCL58157.1 radical SAM/SPASM domain-containing protein [Spirochaetia bacterium]
MVPSKYNLITEISPDQFAVYNSLSGAFDIANLEEKERFEKGIPFSEDEKQFWLERGYYFDSKQKEEEYIQTRWEDFQIESSKNGVQFLLVGSYACNFACPYCYQGGIANKEDILSDEKLEAFIQFVIQYRKENKKEVYITLFGGEPLLKRNEPMIRKIVEASKKENIPLSVVTNGYYLKEFLPILKDAPIHEIQVTFDGDQEIHDKRRVLKDGTKSFQKIFEGLEAALQSFLPLHIRLITDRETLPSFPALAEKLDRIGVLKLPKHLFKTSLGRNYELLDSYQRPKDLFSLDEMYREYTDLMVKNPILAKLHTPSYFGITQIVKEREMYLPSFDTCPAGKSEFVFDYSGNIYGCTASCGREGYEIGQFYPELVWNEKALLEWKTRSILTIEECKDCPVGVVCGGGCGVIANDENGKVQSPNCKPVKEVMDIGIRYFKDLL